MKGVLIFFGGNSVSLGLMGPNASAFSQVGYASDAYGKTIFTMKGSQLTLGTHRDIGVLFDIDIFEAGVGYYWRGNSFESFYNNINYITVSAADIDVSADPGKKFFMFSAGISGGGGISTSKVKEVDSYSMTYEEFDRLEKIYPLMDAGWFEVINKEQEKGIEEGDLVLNVNGSYIDMGLRMQKKDEDKGINLWKSENYIKKQNKEAKSIQQHYINLPKKN